MVYHTKLLAGIRTAVYESSKTKKTNHSKLPIIGHSFKAYDVDSLLEQPPTSRSTS